MEQTVGVHKEVTSAVFRVRDFPYICTPGEKAGVGSDAQDLERNSVSSGSILQAGEYSFKVIVAWSLSHEGSITDYSMLGIAIQRVGGGEEPVVMQLELRLVNRDPCQDIAMRSNIQPLRNTLGWYPSPYAMGREQADGFIPLRSVLDPSNGWLIEDTLTVECKMTVSLSRVTSLPNHKTTPPDALADLSSSFGSLLDVGRMSDVTVVCGEERINAHSVVLAARSPVFEKMWSPPWSTALQEGEQKEVKIDLEPAAVKRMLRFMYTGSLGEELQNDSETVSLLEAAHHYQVNVLIEHCVAALSSHLTVDIVAERLMVADLAGLESLRRACLSYITDSTGRVAAVQTTEGFAQLTKKRPHLAVDILAAAFPPPSVETIAV